MAGDDGDQFCLHGAVRRLELDRLVRVIHIPRPTRVQILEMRRGHTGGPLLRLLSVDVDGEQHRWRLVFGPFLDGEQVDGGHPLLAGSGAKGKAAIVGLVVICPSNNEFINMYFSQMLI